MESLKRSVGIEFDRVNREVCERKKRRARKATARDAMTVFNTGWEGSAGVFDSSTTAAASEDHGWL